jgi:hypothetical protein
MNGVDANVVLGAFPPRRWRARDKAFAAELFLGWAVLQQMNLAAD